MHPPDYSTAALLLVTGSLICRPVLAQHPVTAAPPVVSGRPGISLLNKAIAAVERSQARDSTSEMQMTAAGQGMTFAFRERLHVVLQKPAMFHSDVTLLQPGGAAGAKYTVVSDGVRVWIYQPGARQYAVLSRDAFQGDDLSALGLFGSLISETMHGGGGRLDLKDLTRQGVAIHGGTETAGGIDYQAIAMSDPKQGYTFRLLLDPQTAEVHRLSLNGRQQGLTFLLAETVSGQSPMPTQPFSQFHFTPPPGVRRVKKISIGPF